MRSASQSQFSNSLMTRKNVSIISLYGLVYVTVLDAFKSSVSLRVDETSLVPELIFYKICLTPGTPHERVVVAQLAERGSFFLNVWDNLVIVHNMARKHSLVYDIKASDPAHPIVGPQSFIFDFLHSSHSDEYEEGVTTHWVSYLPDLILSPSTGTLYRLSVDLNALCLSMERMGAGLFSAEVIDMLMRRCSSTANELVIQVLIRMMELQVKVECVQSAFDILLEAAVSKQR